MASQQLRLDAESPRPLIGNRVLGTIGMLAAPMLLIEFVLRAAVYGPAEPPRWVAVLGFLYMLGWLATAAGMRRLRVTGSGKVGRAISWIQIGGLILAALWSLNEATGVNPGKLFFSIGDAAWPFSHLFMLVVAGFIVKAGVWRGKRAVPAAICGLALPLFFGLSPVIGPVAGSIAFGATTTVGFVLLGYLVRVSHPAKH